MNSKSYTVLGWIVWQVGKRLARRKARQVVPAIDARTKRPNRSAVVVALAALVGAGAWLWSRNAGEDDHDTSG